MQQYEQRIQRKSFMNSIHKRNSEISGIKGFESDKTKEFLGFPSNILKTSESNDKLRRQSSIAIQFSISNSQVLMTPRSANKSEIKKNFYLKKAKMIEEGQTRIPPSHLRRNAVLKREFEIQQTIDKIDQENDLLTNSQIANEKKQKQLEILKQQLLKEEKQYFGQQLSIYNAQCQDIMSSQLIDVRATNEFSNFTQDNDENAKIIKERININLAHLEKVNTQINREIERSNEMEYMTGCIKKSKINLQLEVNDMNILNEKYDQEINGMNEKLLLLDKQILYYNYHHNEIQKLVGGEETKYIESLKTFRVQVEQEATQLKDNLKHYNLMEDQTQKLSKKLEQTEDFIKMLESDNNEIVEKINDQYGIIKVMNTFNILVSTFIYNKPNQEDGIQLSQIIQNLDDMNTRNEKKRESMSHSDYSNLLVDKIKKFEQLHHQKFDIVVDQLITLFKDFQNEDQTMKMRVEDLLIQKNNLINDYNDYLDEDVHKEIRDLFQSHEKQKEEYKHLLQLQKQREKQESLTNFEFELKDIQNMEQLVSKCYLFFGQILFRFCRTLMSVRVNLYQVETKLQEEKLISRQSQEDYTGEMNSKTKEYSQFNFEEDKENEDDLGQINDILNKNQNLFSSLDEIIKFVLQSKSLIIQANQNQTNNASLFSDHIQEQEKQAETKYLTQKAEQLKNLYFEQLIDLPDIHQEFFEFLKKDFIIYYFCSNSHFIEYFQVVREKIKQELEQQILKSQKSNNQKSQSQNSLNSSIMNITQDEEKDQIEKQIFQEHQKSTMLEVMLSNLSQLRILGEKNFEKIINSLSTFTTYLIDQSSTYSKYLIDHNYAVYQNYQPPISLSQQIIEDEKKYFKTFHQPEVVTHFNPKKIKDWKADILSKKIEELKKQKGLDEIQQKMSSRLKSRSRQSDSMISSMYISTSTKIAMYDQSPIQNDNVEVNEEDEIEMDEGDYMKDQRFEQKLLRWKQKNQIQNQNAQNSIEQFAKATFSNYMENKRRQKKVIEEEKILWQSKRNFEKDCSMVHRNIVQLNPLTYADLKQGFSTHRTQLKMQFQQHKKQSKKQINQFQPDQSLDLTKPFELHLQEKQKSKDDNHKDQNSPRGRSSTIDQQKSLSALTSPTQLSSCNPSPQKSRISIFNNKSSKSVRENKNQVKIYQTKEQKYQNSSSKRAEKSNSQHWFLSQKRKYVNSQLLKPLHSSTKSSFTQQINFNDQLKQMNATKPYLRNSHQELSIERENTNQNIKNIQRRLQIDTNLHENTKENILMMQDDTEWLQYPQQSNRSKMLKQNPILTQKVSNKSFNYNPQQDNYSPININQVLFRYVN